VTSFWAGFERRGELQKLASNALKRFLRKTDPDYVKAGLFDKMVKEVSLKAKLPDSSTALSLNDRINGRRAFKGAPGHFFVREELAGVGGRVIRARARDGAEIGRAGFHYKPSAHAFEAHAVDVGAPARRKGVATAMYAHLENSGARIKPSAEQKSDGIDFWRARRGKKPLG
jgi:hypothetical protein